MKIEVGKWYVVKQDWFFGEGPFSVKVIRIGVFRVYCRWTTHNLDYDYRYEDCGWISKRRFICEKKDWLARRMTFVDPDTGLVITCQPWEYAEQARVYLNKAVKVKKSYMNVDVDLCEDGTLYIDDSKEGEQLAVYKVVKEGS